MKLISRLSVNILLLLCIFIYSIDGFSAGRNRLRRSISKRIGNKTSGKFSVFDVFYNAYKYTANLFNFRNDKTANKDRQSSGVSGCADCFMGLQVARREAYVVGN